MIMAASLGDWAQAAAEAGATESLHSLLDQTRTDSYEQLLRLNLPHYARRLFRLSEFLDQPGNCLGQLPAPAYYVSISVPGSKHLPRFREIGLRSAEVIDFVTGQNYQNESAARYRVLLQEHYESIYGGNILINQASRVYVEAVQGNQCDLDWGRRTPDLIIMQDEFLRTFKYSFADPLLRRKLLNAIFCLPHWKVEGHLEFPPGYYAFSLINRFGTELNPVCLDMHAGPLFRLG
jgi:hypothetical protein